MNSLAASLLAFLGIACAALLGMFLSRKLPVQHHGPESKHVVRLGMGLVATTVAVIITYDFRKTRILLLKY